MYQYAEDLFRLLCDANTTMIAIVELVRSKPRVINVVRTNDARQFPNNLIFSIYVDAECINGLAYSWILEFTLDNAQWGIEASIRTSNKDGQDIVHEFPDRLARDFEDFLRTAKEAERWLLFVTEKFNC